jgi:hypothetical protein
LLLGCALLVIVFDPFYHYHKPLPFLKAVLTEKEYQVPGTLRNFDYDALIVGSSVVENNNNDWYSQDFSCNAIKAVRSYGATADLCYLLDIAYEDHYPKYVFYNIDPTSLHASTVPTYESTGAPMYLYDRNPLNDYSYLLNKDVLFKRIPYMLVQSLMADYDPARSYNWEESKVFAESAVLSHYPRYPRTDEMKAEDVYREALDDNIALLTEQVRTHPDTHFYFFFPVYSMLFWDNAYRTGDSDAFVYDEKKAAAALLDYENVSVFYFQNDEEIACNLDNYMDTLHFTSEINHYMEQCMVNGQNRITHENLDSTFDSMHDFVLKIRDEYMPEYEKKDLFIYDETP